MGRRGWRCCSASGWSSPSGNAAPRGVAPSRKSLIDRGLSRNWPASSTRRSSPLTAPIRPAERHFCRPRRRPGGILRIAGRKSAVDADAVRTVSDVCSYVNSVRRVMHKPVKYVEKGLTYVAKGAWVVFDALNSIKPNESFTRSGRRSRC